MKFFLFYFISFIFFFTTYVDSNETKPYKQNIEEIFKEYPAKFIKE